MPAPSKCSLGTASWVQLALAIVTENIYCSGRIRSVENPSAYVIFLVAHILLYITNNERIIIRLQRPESGCVVWALACVGVCVVRPFPGGRHSHAARRAGRDRGASGARASGAGASGAGDAVNG